VGQEAKYGWNFSWICGIMFLSLWVSLRPSGESVNILGGQTNEKESQESDQLASGNGDGSQRTACYGIRSGHLCG
jgi:hypothetical protein